MRSSLFGDEFHFRFIFVKDYSAFKRGKVVFSYSDTFSSDHERHQTDILKIVCEWDHDSDKNL